MSDLIIQVPDGKECADVFIQENDYSDIDLCYLFERVCGKNVCKKWGYLEDTNIDENEYPEKCPECKQAIKQTKKRLK